MNLTRITRLLRVIGLLQGGRGHNVKSLAEQSGVSRRTIFRDLETLRQAGLSIVFDEKLDRYFLPGTQVLPPTNLTSEEALALIVLSYEMGGSDRVPFYGAARRAAIKLESSLPSALRDQLRGLLGSIELRQPPPEGGGFAASRLKPDFTFVLRQHKNHRRFLYLMYSNAT